MGFSNNTDNSTPSEQLFGIVIKTVLDMKDGDASNDLDKYFKNVIWGLQLTMQHLDLEVRKRLQNDLNKLYSIIDQINEMKEMHEETKKKEIRKIKKSFADTHRHYIFKGMGKMGIYKVSKEGELDWNKTDNEQLIKAIRGGSSLKTNLERSGLENKK